MLKSIDFWPLVPKKLSVESSINDDVHQKSMFNVHCTNTKQRRKRQNYTSSFVFQMRNLAENKGGNFKIYIFYCEFSCFGFSHSQDDRAGISKNLQLFLSLPWLFLDCILSCIPVFLFVFLEYCGMQSCYALF